MERGHLICEFDNKDSVHSLSTNPFQYGFTSKNNFLFVKCLSLTTNKTQLLTHSLRLISKLDDYFSLNQPVLSSCQPTNSSLSERIKNLMQARIEDLPARKDRLRNVWSELSQRTNNQSTQI